MGWQEQYHIILASFQHQYMVCRVPYLVLVTGTIPFQKKLIGDAIPMFKTLFQKMKFYELTTCYGHCGWIY